MDPRVYSCADLHNVVATRGFIFITSPNFADFVVSSASYCSGQGVGVVLLQRRSVPTSDDPECLVDYCGSNSGMNGSGGMSGGM